MDTNKNPKLIKNGGKGTNVGNAKDSKEIFYTD